MQAFTITPILHQNQPPRESIICDTVSTWRTKMALIMLKFLPKTRQKRLCRVPVHKYQHGKHVSLQPQARAVAGHTAHGQRRQHHGNAEVICHRQPVFNLHRAA